ncbi:histidine decarboxylase [Vibrio aerogenes CECT 7868]|uniref:Histidine decarboxylase n=1 Tax=Vibrio aerogenes CECT 7868 TaxID=1216006 RepID=A0A1M6B567_9VIBR|nr:pyridoxal-dependent decarboxylase [Vibrio aerogenes]SHI43613.1 histidine decarboxylase [Vibrio aerogenes CECT 7868]
MEKTIGRPVVSGSVLSELKQFLSQGLDKVQVQDDRAIAAWFMGTKGENLDMVKNLVTRVIEETLYSRAELFPGDPAYITQEVKASAPYQQAKLDIAEKSNSLLDILTRYSVPFSSLRYQGHMTWDVTLPSVLGYLAGMLQNQNNVTPQAAPATTLLEILAANDIAQMAGFSIRPLTEENDDDQLHAWSHITCDGTVANIESVWAARELKYMPLGIKYALGVNPAWQPLSGKLKLKDGQLLARASAWQLMNLTQDESLALPGQIAQLTGEEESAVWKLLGSKYSLNAKGMSFFSHQYLQPEKIHTPAIVVPSSKHYSWVKSTSLLGMGGGQSGLSEAQLTDINVIQDDALLNIYVDHEGRVDTTLLQRVLDTCKAHKKPILLNVAVVGSTEEGAVDPVESLLAIREAYRQDTTSPFEYAIHTDAAWGGYFMACIRRPFEMNEATQPTEMFTNQSSWFRDSVYQSMCRIHQCDSVTIDPHKMGYIPYPAGSLTYRNENVINLLGFTAPYISSGGQEKGISTRNIGDSGIEGSKPGAAASAVFLSHQVIRPDQRGYGDLINQSMLNSKLFYLYMATLGSVFPDDKFRVELLHPLPQVPEEHKSELIRLLWEAQAGKEMLMNSAEVIECLRAISGDQNIVDYVFIDKQDDSEARTLALNTQLFEQLSVQPGVEVGADQIFVSMTTFHRSDYGNTFIDSLANRVYPAGVSVDAVPCIRSVILDPWAIYTHTPGQTSPFNFFTDIFFPKLRDAVNGLCVG